MTNYLGNYEQFFSLQDSQPYCLTNDFANNNWTPKGTYWVSEPKMKVRSILTFPENKIVNSNGVYKTQTLNYDGKVYNYNNISEKNIDGF